MTSTDPYIQGIAEALGAGQSRPSVPWPDVPRFVFPFDEETLFDLVWLREISIMMYKLHATMNRCAKGQTVDVVPHDIPRWVPD
jgi:hypothetical protein